MEPDFVFDFVVVGAGYAGLTAANRACELGRRVAVLERGRDEHYPCNSRFAGGVLHISYRNLDDPPADLAAAALAITGGAADATLVQALADNALRAVRWLEAQGAKCVGVGNIGWRQFILAPPRPPVARMDWEGRGADVTLRLLERNLARRGGELHRGTRARRLIVENGRCVGVEAEHQGHRRTYRAGAVLLADGGFQADPALVRAHISAAPEKLKQRCAPTGTGDGLRMALEAGAAARGLDAFYGHVLARDAMHNDDLWPYPMLDEIAAASVVVAPTGRRFCDEGLGGIAIANAIAKLPDPLSSFAVFDDAVWEGPGRASSIPPNPGATAAGAELHCADTLQDLARRAGLPVSALEETVARYNEALSSGRADALDPPRSTGRHPARPIVQPPFRALPLCAGITYTMGGIAIDAHGRVLKPDGSVLPGLYAAGSTTGGLDGGRPCGYVGGLVKAIVFGLLSGEHVGAQALPRAAAG